jgi:hypothetical protein
MERPPTSGHEPWSTREPWPTRQPWSSWGFGTPHSSTRRCFRCLEWCATGFTCPFTCFPMGALFLSVTCTMRVLLSASRCYAHTAVIAVHSAGTGEQAQSERSPSPAAGPQHDDSNTNGCEFSNEPFALEYVNHSLELRPSLDVALCEASSG